MTFPCQVVMPVYAGVRLVHECSHNGRIVTVLNDVLQAIATEIKSATTSMTSVPKPLKFLRQHYSGLKATCDAMPEGSANKAALADVLSVLAMNSGAEGLKYRLAGSSDSVGAWGHEYVRYHSRV
jgi:RPN1 N-terminal domain